MNMFTDWKDIVERAGSTFIEVFGAGLVTALLAGKHVDWPLLYTLGLSALATVFSVGKNIVKQKRAARK